MNSIPTTYLSGGPHLASPFILSHLLSLHPTLLTLRFTGIASHRLHLRSLGISLTGFDHIDARIARGMRPAREDSRCDVAACVASDVGDAHGCGGGWLVGSWNWKLLCAVAKV